MLVLLVLSAVLDCGIAAAAAAPSSEQVNAMDEMRMVVLAHRLSGQIRLFVRVAWRHSRPTFRRGRQSGAETIATVWRHRAHRRFGRANVASARTETMRLAGRDQC